jgi:hypothetical protein
MAELAFEQLLAAREVVRGTKIDPPTHCLNLVGTLRPVQSRYRPNESRGTLAETYRVKRLRQGGEWSGEGPADVYTLPLIGQWIIKGDVTAGGIMALPWAPVTVEAVNNLLLPTGWNGHYYMCTDYGSAPHKTGATEPTWPTGVGGTVTDGDLTWTEQGLAATIWTAITAHAVGDLALAVAANGHYYKCTNYGAVPHQTGVSEPTWPTSSGGTVADGDLTWTEQGAIGVFQYVFRPTMTADDLETATLYWGDPNVQYFQADYCCGDELVLGADVGGTDGCRMTVKGQCHLPAKETPDSVPAMLDAPLLAPSDLELWIDTTSPIGTTAVTGRVISVEERIPSGKTYKYLATGPTGTQEFAGTGRNKRHVELKLVLELVDTTQYDLWVAATILKTRLRLNGAEIATGYRYYINSDLYGPFEALDWGEYEGSNRTVQLTILSQYDTTIGRDFSLTVQNDRGVV